VSAGTLLVPFEETVPWVPHPRPRAAGALVIGRGWGLSCS